MTVIAGGAAGGSRILGHLEWWTWLGAVNGDGDR